MGLIKTSGIITKTTKYGDTSLIVTILTQDFGKISAIASGGRTKRSSMLASLQLFSLSEIVMYKSKSKKGLYHLNEMTVTESFSNLRCDLDKMAYASYFAEATNTVCAEDSPDNEILRLFLNVLYVLDKGKEPYEKIKTVFEWRLAKEAGYAPLLDCCTTCGCNLDSARLNLSQGISLCDSCGSSDLPQLSETMVKIVRYIIDCDSRKLFFFDASAATLKYLSQVSELYLMAQLDRGFTTLDYLKKVQALETNYERKD